jgi:hypothetical protein
MTGDVRDKQQVPPGTHQDPGDSVALDKGRRGERCGVAPQGKVVAQGTEGQEALAKYYLTDDAHIENVCVSLRLHRKDYLECATRLLAQWRATDEQDWSRRHFFFALKDFIKFNYERDKTNRSTPGGPETPEQWKQRIGADALSRYQQEINS